MSGAMRSGQRLTLFDLDNTLLGGDSDYGWAQFLIEQGAVDAESYERRNAAFFADYKAGRLDIHAFLEFQLRPLAENQPAALLAWRDRFVAEKIRPMLLPAGQRLVAERLDAGDLVAVVTATNSFITRPIAALYGIGHLIATEPEMVAGRFTGRTTGEPCFQAGKLACLNAWLSAQQRSLRDFSQSWFYSDSHNDLPLLLAVTHPVAVDPDPLLTAEAASRGWPVANWRR
ncbi:MAG TPA: HAD family hydrolase [Casimicrobiaceae bacterium]|jgi:HAD superfamily hydrolase (TIGR01490 family)